MATAVEFQENKKTLLQRFGLQAASLSFIAGSVWLMAQNAGHVSDVTVAKNIIAPIFLFAANIAGLCKCERLQNTLGMIGSAALTAHYAGAETGQIAYGKAALFGLGVYSAYLGSHLRPKKTRQQKEKLDHVFQDDLVQSSTTSGGGNVYLLIDALVNGTSMIGPTATWVAGSLLKIGQGVQNAQQRVQPKAAA